MFTNDLYEMAISKEDFASKSSAWYARREGDLDLFDALAEGIDGCLGYSFERLRDLEYKSLPEEDDWN